MINIEAFLGSSDAFLMSFIQVSALKKTKRLFSLVLKNLLLYENEITVNA